jgi:hypothetical protein
MLPHELQITQEHNYGQTNACYANQQTAFAKEYDA